MNIKIYIKINIKIILMIRNQKYLQKNYKQIKK